LKLPILVHHFFEHKHLQSDLTLTDFLYMHYVVDHDGDSDNDKDHHLPFKTHDNNTTLSVAFFPLCESNIAAIHFPSSSNKHCVLADGLYLSAHLSAIWQPPKHG
jgi:hypothetical protein